MITFHVQWHFSQVQRQPPCRGCSRVRLGSHHMISLANRTQVTVEIVVARSHNCTRSQNPERCPFQEKSRLLPKTVSEMAKTSPQKGFPRGNLACSYCCKKVEQQCLSETCENIWHYSANHVTPKLSEESDDLSIFF